ncbi:hypothetical protein J4714_14565 [Staphylococcus epidermidis]|nr:hypothetical protein [Staphylococcus epidermidis]
MFCGIGVGALLAATLVPMFARSNLSAVVGADGAVRAGVAGGLAGRAPGHHAPMAITPAATAAVPAARLWSLAVVLVFIAYACDAFGFVPHTVFWVDYLDRELQLGAGYAFTNGHFRTGCDCRAFVCGLLRHALGWWGTTTGPMHSRPWP